MVRHRRAKLAVLAAAAVFGALGGVAVAASTNSLPFAADNGQTTAATRPSPGVGPRPRHRAPPPRLRRRPRPRRQHRSLARRTATVRMRPDPRSTDSAPRTQPGRAPRMGTGPTRPRSRRWHQPPVAPTTSPPSVPTRPRAAETRRRPVDRRARRTVRGTSTPIRPAASPGPLPTPEPRARARATDLDAGRPTTLLTSFRPVPGCRPGGSGGPVTHTASVGVVAGGTRRTACSWTPGRVSAPEGRTSPEPGVQLSTLSLGLVRRAWTRGTSARACRGSSMSWVGCGESAV